MTFDTNEKTLEELIEELPEDLNADNPEEPEENPEETPDPDQTEDPEENPEETSEEPEETKEEPEDPAEPQTNSEFAKIRKEHTYIARLAKAEGLSVEDYIKKTQDELSKARAEKNNIPEEFQKKFDEMERALAEIKEKEQEEAEALQLAEQEKARVDLVSRLNKLKDTFELSREDLIKFGEKARDAGYPIGQPGFDLVNLYKFMNPTDNKDLKEQLRQEILKELKNKNAPSPGDQNPGTPDGGSKSLRDLAAKAEDFFKN